ncbi:MAG: PaaI family thioesterase [Chloroflexota bacterium]
MVDALTPNDAAIAAGANASPLYQLLGLRVMAVGGGEARLELPVGERFHQRQGAVHGGITATLADACIGIALTSALPAGQRAVTVEMKINYLAPVKEGRLIGRGRVVHRGARLLLGEAEISDQDGRLVAKALATYTILSRGGAATQA